MNEYQWYQDEFSHSPVQEGYKPVRAKKGVPAWLVALLVSIGICAVFMLVLVYAVLPRMRPSTVISYVGGGEGGQAQAPLTSGSVGEIGTRALESVVRVENQGSIGGFFNQMVSYGEGAGVIVSEDGYILTSSYIVESSGNITVTLPDKTEYEARVAGTDSQSDVAILKIEATGLTPVVFGDSDTVALGDAVVAVGSPIAEQLSSSVTSGTICGIDKGVELQDGRTVNLFQTDAAMLEGSVGGVLLNSAGQVIAMTNALVSDSAELKLATPINDVKPVLEGLLNNGQAPQTPMIGIMGTDADYGVNISSVSPDTPADRAGLKAGDLIVKVNGQAVQSVAQINEIRSQHSAGDTLTFTIYREGELLEIEVTLN